MKRKLIRIEFALVAGLLAAGCTTSGDDESQEPLPQTESGAESGDTDTAEARETPSATGANGNWLSYGHDLSNTRNQSLEFRINPSNAAKLGVKWKFEAGGDIWATASVDNTSVYFPDATGNLFALNKATGKVRWTKKVSEYTGVPNDLSRNTPAIFGNALFLGGQGGRSQQGATVYSVDKRNGNKVWATKVEDNPSAVITSSPVVFGNRVYVGVSSFEEVFAARAPGYKCCTFRGSVVALDRNTGAILWKTYMTSDKPDYSGVAIWSSPALDVTRGSLYITTGNNYHVPQAFYDCKQNSKTPAELASCAKRVPGSADNHFDSIVSLDMNTGKIKWAHSMSAFDSWNIACLQAAPGNEGNCQDKDSQDYDFGNPPMVMSARVNGRQRTLIGAGQKSGVFWAVDPDTGAVVWSTQVGPGGSLGGLEWGSAYDGTRIYTALSNSKKTAFKLPNGEETTSGMWAALDPGTGKLLWATRGEPAVTGTNQGPLAVANGVVYAGTIDAAGTMYALDAASGKTLWTFRSGGSVNTSPAIVDGVLYWGSGYGVSGFGITPNKYFFALALNYPKTEVITQPPQPDAGDGGPVVTPPDGGPGGPSFSALYNKYLNGSASLGHCSDCHGTALTASATYDWLKSRGFIAGTGSTLTVQGKSPFSWFGGNMPPGGPQSAPEAANDFKAWVAAGALNN